MQRVLQIVFQFSSSKTLALNPLHSKSFKQFCLRNKNTAVLGKEVSGVQLLQYYIGTVDNLGQSV